MLLAILARRGGPVDAERGARRDLLGAHPDLTDLVACLVEPYASLLASPSGRSYLQIVGELRGQFAAWRVESDEATTTHLARILDEIEAEADVSAPERAERVVALIMLITGPVAERARRIDAGAPIDLDHQRFVANLVAMCAAVITA